jgi:hypothetical protein
MLDAEAAACAMQTALSSEDVALGSILLKNSKVATQATR